MKKILLFLSLLVCLKMEGQGSYVTTTFQDSGQHAKNINVVFTPLSTPILGIGPSIYSLPQSVIATNGYLAPYFLYSGNYSVTFGPQYDTIRIGITNNGSTNDLFATQTNFISIYTNFTSLFFNFPSVVAGTNVTVVTNTNSFGIVYYVVSAGTNGSSGGGSGGANVGAGTNVVTTTNVVGGVTNVTVSATGVQVSAGVNTSTSTNVVNGVTSVTVNAVSTSFAAAQAIVSSTPFNPVQDSRPLAVYDLKGVFPPSNTLYVLCTNNGTGGGTIDDILIDYIPSVNDTDQPILSVWTDGISNGCQLLSYVASQGKPLIGWQCDTIRLKSQPNVNYGIGRGVERRCYFNARTNFSVAITLPFWYNNGQIWTDIEYRSGCPVTSNYCYISEIKAMPTAGQTVSVGALTGVAGQFESYTFFLLSPTQLAFESRPSLYLDGFLTLWNGTEDSVGGSWYWDEETKPIATDQDGAIPTPFLKNRYGYAHGAMMYRFYNGAFFNNSFTLNITNTTGTTISNDILAVYYAPYSP